MNVMKHVSTQEISDFLDGTLSVSKMRETAMHMDQCDPCTKELEAWKKTRAMLRRAPKSVTPGPDFWAATAARLTAEDQSPSVAAPALSFKTMRPSFGSRMTAFVSMAAAIVGVGFLYGHLPMATVITPPGHTTTTDIDNDDVSSFIRAHTEAAATQPLADGSRQLMLAVDADDQPAAGDTTSNGDSNP